MDGKIAKIAVSAATYWIDRPYDYLIPEEWKEKALPGARVMVPFSRGDRKSEGVILELSDHSDYEAPKPILAVLDEEPVLTEEQIRRGAQETLAPMQTRYAHYEIGIADGPEAIAALEAEIESRR